MIVSQDIFIRRMLQEGKEFYFTKRDKKFLISLSKKIYRAFLENEGFFNHGVMFSLRELRFLNGTFRSFIAKCFKLGSFSIGNFVCNQSENFSGLIEPRLVAGGVLVNFNSSFYEYFAFPIRELKNSYFDSMHYLR